MRTLISLALVMALGFSIAGCGKKDAEDPATPAPAVGANSPDTSTTGEAPPPVNNPGGMTPTKTSIPKGLGAGTR